MVPSATLTVATAAVRTTSMRAASAGFWSAGLRCIVMRRAVVRRAVVGARRRRGAVISRTAIAGILRSVTAWLHHRLVQTQRLAVPAGVSAAATVVTPSGALLRRISGTVAARTTAIELIRLMRLTK